MNKLFLIIFAFLSAVCAHADDFPSSNMQVELSRFVQPAQSSVPVAVLTDVQVSVAPVPMPEPIVEIANFALKNTGAPQAKKIKAAKVARAKSILSRAVREQIALAHAAGKRDDKDRIDAWDDGDDDESGLDDLDLHRSYSHPKVAKLPDQFGENGDHVDLSPYVRLRLLLARTKAVEAYVFGKIASTDLDSVDDLSDSVKERLASARARAVQAHIARHDGSVASVKT